MMCTIDLNKGENGRLKTTQWFIWEVCDFTYLGIIHDWGHGSICPWNEVNFKGSGARSTPQNLQTCPRSVPKMAKITLKKVSSEFLNLSERID